MRWEDVVARALYPYPELMQLTRVLPSMSLSNRKHVLSLCQIQSVFLPGSPLYTLVDSHTLNYMVTFRSTWLTPFSGNACSFQEYLHRVSLWTAASLMVSSILSILIRAAPVSSDDWLQVKQQAIMKELSASVTIYHPISFNYRACMDPAYFRESLVPNLEPSVSINSSIYSALSRSRDTLHGRTLWPDFGNRSMGVVCQGKSDLYDVYNRRDFPEQFLLDVLQFDYPVCYEFEVLCPFPSWCNTYIASVP